MKTEEKNNSVLPNIRVQIETLNSENGIFIRFLMLAADISISTSTRRNSTMTRGQLEQCVRAAQKFQGRNRKRTQDKYIKL